MNGLSQLAFKSTLKLYGYLPVEVNQCSVDGLNGFLACGADEPDDLRKYHFVPYCGLMLDGFGSEGDGMDQ